MIRDELRRVVMAVVEYLADFGMEYFGRYYATYRGYVRENRDPEDRGRILVEVPIVSDIILDNWAEPKGMSMGQGAGWFTPPPIDDPEGTRSVVWVSFENGDPRFPVYDLGWFGEGQVPPEFTRTNPGSDDEDGADGDPVYKRGFKTPGGSYLRFSDDPEEREVRLLWTNEDGQVAFFNIDNDGSILMQAANGSSLSLSAKDEETTFFGPPGSPSASFSMTQDGIKAIGPDGQILEFRPQTVFIQSDGNVQILSAGAFLTMTNGEILITAKDGTHVQVAEGKVQVAAGGGPTMVVDAEGARMMGVAGETISLKAGKIQMNAPGGGILLSSSSGVTMDAGAIIGGASAVENPLKAQTFLAMFDAHTHLSAAPGAPTGPPVIPLSTMAATLAALKCKVG